MRRVRVNPHQPELPGLDRPIAGPGPGSSAAPVPDQTLLRQAAEAALARRQERRRAKALALELALVEEERRTEAYLRRQAEAAERAKRDPRLDLLLASRSAGKPVDQAIAEVERRFRRSSPRA